jgi:hypothetical protein
MPSWVISFKSVPSSIFHNFNIKFIKKNHHSSLLLLVTLTKIHDRTSPQWDPSYPSPPVTILSTWHLPNTSLCRTALQHCLFTAISLNQNVGVMGKPRKSSLAPPSLLVVSSTEFDMNVTSITPSPMLTSKSLTLLSSPPKAPPYLIPTVRSSQPIIISFSFQFLRSHYSISVIALPMELSKTFHCLFPPHITILTSR